MGLPTLAVKTYEAELPSNEVVVEYRQYTAKEERALLVANESKDENQQLRAMLNLVDACCLTEGIEAIKLPSIDLQWLFLQIRINSIGNEVEIPMKCTNEECGFEYNVKFDLNDAKIMKKHDHNLKFNLTEDIGIEFKLPSAEDSLATKSETETEQFYKILERCVVMVWDKNGVYKPGVDFNEEQISEFIGTIPQMDFEKMAQKVFVDSPQMVFEKTITCPKCGHVEEMKVEGLLNFFS